MRKPVVSNPDDKRDDDNTVVGNDGTTEINDGANGVIDPGTIEPAADIGGSGGTRRGRGRPRKSGDGGSAGKQSKPAAEKRTRKAANSASLDVGTLSLLCSFASGFVAARVHEDTLKLDEEEAGQVAEALANVGKHYDIPVSPVTQAWIALGATVGGIYAAKIAAIKLKHSMKKPARPEPVPDNPPIVPFAQPLEAAE